MTTNIEWVKGSDGKQGRTWNPVLGCQPISDACAHCFASRMAHRLNWHPNPKVYGPYRGLTTSDGIWTGKVRCLPERLSEPGHWKKPQTVFVCSMSDLFHDDVPFEFIDGVFRRMIWTNQHTYILLTKRPERMLEYLTDRERFFTTELGKITWPLPNVWIGVTAENQEQADKRIPMLLQCPAAVRWISAEPLLGHLDLRQWVPEIGHSVECSICHRRKAPYGRSAPMAMAGSLCDNNCSGWGYEPNPGDLWPGESRSQFGYPTELAERPTLSWVVAGGENGPGSRPFHPEWIRNLRDQCLSARTPYFFKGWGDYAPGPRCYSHPYPDLAGQVRSWTTVSSSGPRLNIGKQNWVAYDAEGNATELRRFGKKLSGRLLDGREWNEMPEVR